MLTNLNFNQLYYFYIVSREGSIKKAVDILHVTQPTISSQIKQLELQLEYNLFVRKHRKLELTKQGEHLFHYANKIFQLADEMIRFSDPKEERRIFRIGVVPSLPNSFVHRFTINMWNNPDISIIIIHGDLNLLINLLNDDKIDVILSDEPYLKFKKKFASFLLNTQELIVVGHKKFSSLKKNFPFSLNNQPYISFIKSGNLQFEIELFLSSRGIKPDYRGEIDDTGLMRMAAEKGIGFIIIPEAAVTESLKRNDLIKIGNLKDISCSGWAITTQQKVKDISLRKAISSHISQNK